MDSGRQDWLRPNETIIYWLRQGPGEALQIALLTGGLTALIPPVLGHLKGESTSATTLVLSAILGIAIGAPHFLRAYRRLELVLTSQRLFVRQGLLARHAGEIPLTDIVSIDDAGAGFRSFAVKTAGGQTWQIGGLPNLDRIRETLLSLTEATVGVR